MRIIDIECIHLPLPGISSVESGHILSCLVKIDTDEGISGYGEAESPVNHCEIEKIKQNIIGSEVYDISWMVDRKMAGLGQNTQDLPPNAMLPGTPEMAAIEFALWDCIGKKLRLPVYKVLGGKVREKVAISLLVSQKPIEDCIKDIARAISGGIGTIKLKIGVDQRRDIDLFKEIRRQFGDDLVVRLDVDQSWGTTDGIRVLKQMVALNPQFVEGALKRNEIRGFKRIREVTGIPVCICEQFNGYSGMSTETALTRTVELIRAEACDVLSLNPSETGGLLGFSKVCAVCEGAGIQVVTHQIGAGISQAVCLTGCITNYATALAHDIVPVGQPSGVVVDLVNETLIHESGYMKPLDSPGWGMTLKENG
jgi:L-alanine-DL-glutamate epimerase-like enolase superfamily enzyme